MRLLTVAFLTLILIGCCPRSDEFERAFTESFLDVIVYGPDRSLWIAVVAFREGSGRWPSSPDELTSDPAIREALQFNRFTNLRFEPLANSGMAIAFDKYRRHTQGGIVGWTNGRVEIPDLMRDRPRQPSTTQSVGRID